MGSTFGGYSVAYSGMVVNKAGLTAVSHNLSNVNTTGFSRQRMVGQDLVSMQQGGNNLGCGSDIQEVKRLRNEFLDETYRQQNGKKGYWEAKSSNIESAATVLNEFSTDDGKTYTGVQKVVQNFFDCWDELSKDAGSLTNRKNVLEAANSLLANLGEIDEEVEQLQYDAANKVIDGVNKVNELAGKIADLNQQITKAEAGESEASDLRDARDILVDEMSSLAGVSVNQQASGKYEVFVGGVSLVSGDKFRTMTVSGDGSKNNPLEVKWADLNCAVEFDTGSIKGYQEDAEQSGLNDITAANIPYNFAPGDLSSSSLSNLRQGLNTLVTTVALKVNEIHATGTGIDNNHTSGLNFFVAIDTTKPLSIGNMIVNPLLTAQSSDANKIAASTTGLSSDNTLAVQINNLSKNAALFQYDGLAMDSSDFYKSVITWLGTAGDNADSYAENQANLVSEVDSQRNQISGVSTDEEMSSMIVYQNAYSASARVLNTLDSLIKDMISDLGR